jgi:hypothetical protein
MKGHTSSRMSESGLAGFQCGFPYLNGSKILTVGAQVCTIVPKYLHPCCIQDTKGMYWIQLSGFI